MKSNYRCITRWIFICSVALVQAISGRTAAQTGELARAPILRIETGMHTAAIRRIGVDRAGKFLVTASEDKTARVWEVETGRLLRVLRVPVGDGTEGKLYAAAISPDGNTIAVGGATSIDGRHVCVYLFERETGKLMRRLTGVAGAVLHLVFSPDSAALAATLYNTNGVQVWRTSDWVEIGRELNYGDASYCGDFDRAGRLVTSSFDGKLRLYDREMHLIAKSDAGGGKAPFVVRFTPDGSKVAVGYDDSDRVEVLSGITLAHLFSADTTGISIANRYVVGWSLDGTMLYAGGNYKNTVSEPSCNIRRWRDGGRGSYLDAPAASDTIVDIEPLPGGGIVYGSSAPMWGTLDANHKLTQPAQTAQIADYRDADFLVNARADALRFAFEPSGRSPAVFQLSDRTLRPDVPATSDMRPPRTEALGLNVTERHNRDGPQLNGKSLNLKGEVSFSLAITSDGEGFLLSTNLRLRFYNRSGRELWSVFPPDVAWAVNISGNGQFALAAYGDGTIRWYRMTDGKELLAFFPHADRKRWVLWTPSGYYDASPGAEELIGWHVNNGNDQAADFFPAGQFRSTYYRPDVISKILETGDEARALQLANEERGRKSQASSVAQMLPPVVEIASPADNAEVSSSEVTIRYSVRTPSGEPVTNVRALVDGRPVSGNRQLTREDNFPSETRELRIPVPAHDSEVSIIAENRFAVSVPATIHLKWRGLAPTTEVFVIQPKLYVLAIGVSQYQNDAYSLKFAAKDATDFAAAAASQKGLLYRDVVVKILTNDQATKDNVLDGLDWIRKETTSKDVAMVFFAGHGINDQSGVYYFLPYNTDLERLLRTGVPFTDIKTTVQSLAGKTLFFIDTCHSGNVLGGRRGLADDLNGVINELASAESGAVVFAASTGNQYSLEDVKWNNGAFTKALVEGFTGRADYGGTGRITINMLDLYLSERVKELTGGRQTPTTAKPNTIQDFPIAVRR
ncbi:MAG TPA: caspase family protein [Pyrinomonadaceae bacterium]|nr:caspase family protein [Pyrinomonadaceae bacterium]